MSLSMTPSDISGSVLYINIQYSTVAEKGQIQIKVRENDKGED